MCENECVFRRLHVYLHEFKVTTPQKKDEFENCNYVSISVLASPHSAIKVEDPLRNLLTLAVIFKKIIRSGD